MTRWLLFLLLLFPAITFSQNDEGGETGGEGALSLHLTQGEFAPHELLLTVVLETEIASLNRDEREISGRIKFSSAGEYLVTWSKLHNEQIETEGFSSGNWYPIEVSRVSGDCRNLLFQNLDTVTVLLSCPGSFNYTYRSTVQFVSLQVLRIPEQSLATTAAEESDVTLSITKGRPAPFALLYSEVLETEVLPSGGSGNFRRIRADLEFSEEGEYLVFVRAIESYIIESSHEGPRTGFGDLRVSLPAKDCQNRIIKDPQFIVETIFLGINCPITGILEASGPARFATIVLLKINP